MDPTGAMQRRLPAGTFFGISQVSRRTGSVGLAESEYRAGTELPEHAHEQHHFVLVLAGKYEEVLDGRRIARASGQVLFLPGGVPHAERHLTAGKHFMIDPPESWIRRLDLLPADLSHPSVVTQGAVVQAAMRLYHKFLDPAPLSARPIEAIAQELLVSFGRERLQAREGCPPRFLRLARDILYREFKEPPGDDAVAREVGVSPGHLRRSFQHRYRLPMGEFVRERRLQFAVEQLLDTDARLADVATGAGFFDQSHFGKEFRKKYGTTPARFRRRARARRHH
jgi:AraC family transcriptional regulator